MIAFLLTKREGTEDGPRCAVVGCCEPGRPHSCPYDGERHHHGRIHYECQSREHFAPGSTLAFRAGSWDLICDAHYAQIMAELRVASRARVSA